jgi:hypothetical protein
MIRAYRYAIQASVSSTTSPQAAVVGVVVTDDFELFFDTLDTTRKMRNLRQNPKIAFVIGGTVEGDERTVQYEVSQALAGGFAGPAPLRGTRRCALRSRAVCW